jgi:hypothetical protein
MQLFSWLHKWMTGRPYTRRTPARKPTRRFRPQLEALEDRWLPSTLTVLNNYDSGTGSLRAEIAAANLGDTINFAPSLNGQTINLTSGQLVINKNLLAGCREHGDAISVVESALANSQSASWVATVSAAPRWFTFGIVGDRRQRRSFRARVAKHGVQQIYDRDGDQT